MSMQKRQRANKDFKRFNLLRLFCTKINKTLSIAYIMNQLYYITDVINP